MFPTPSFVTACLVARPLKYRMDQGWGQGDKASNDWFAPLDTFASRFDAMLGEISDSSRTYRWLDPLQLHDRWKPQFMTLCDKICVDLERDVNAS